jgi:peptidoglycan/xylan/chitin deacetylase (PgdA/CDA1 family)
MTSWRRLLPTFYRRASTPYRALRNRRMAAAGQAPISVLIFHRIADDQANNWTTPTQKFVQAIRWLKPRFDLISLAEAQRRISAGANHRPAVSISFDDGYEENCRIALPLLIAERIPCTYFVCTHPVLTGTPFQHDQSMGHSFRPNSVEQLRDLSDAGIEIGAHSRTHPDFGQISDHATLHDELVTARDELANALGKPIRYFAFPFGCPKNLTAEAFRLARSAGYAGVLSAYGGYNFPGDDPFHLQRRGGEGSLERLKNWVTFDPRHDRKIRRSIPEAAWLELPSRRAA